MAHVEVKQTKNKLPSLHVSCDHNLLEGYYLIVIH